jgi:hypothetical protein
MVKQKPKPKILMAKSKKPKPFDVDFTEAELLDFGGELATEIENAFLARADVIGAGGQIDLADWYYEQGRSKAEDLPFPGAADLTSYFITEPVDALKARLMKAVFGVRPFAFVEGWGQDAKKAPYVEEFHDWQVRKSDLKAELGKTILGALIEDGYILEVSERIETRKITETLDIALQLHPDTGGPIFAPHPKTGEPTPQLQMDDQGEPIAAKTDGMGAIVEPSAKVERTHTKTKRLGPQYDPISMKDFVFLPGHAKSIRHTYGYAYRFWKRLSELDEAVADGIYDQTAVVAIGEESDRELSDAPVPVNTVQPQYGVAREKELFQVSLKRDLDEDGRDEWYMATISLKSRRLLRLKLDTFAQRVGRSRCVPFILFPRRDSVYGYSYAFDKLLTLAEEHTGVRNMRADRSALAANKPIMQVQGGLWDSEAQPFGVGRVITVRDHDELKEFNVSDVPSSVIQQEQMLHIAKERVGGLSDSASGVLSAERRTLGEQKLVAGGSAVRVDEVIGYLHTALADVLLLSHAIWEDTLTANPKGLDAPTSVTASIQSRGGEFDGTFTAAMLTGDFQFEPYGSDELADPQKRRADFDSGFVALANLAKVVPGLQVILNSPEVAKATLEQWLRAYNVRDRQPFLGAMQAPPIPAVAAGPGADAMGPPLGTPGMPTGGMPVPGAQNPNIGALMAALQGGAHG